MNRNLKRALKLASHSLVILMVLLALLLVGVRIAGLDVLAVLSPSMEPKYPTGSLIYLVDVEPENLKEEDVITYRITDTTTATHRIKEIIPDKDDPSIVRFRTKGDNNDTYDGNLVEFEQVEGKVIFCIPLLGYLSMYIQNPPGLYIAIGVAMAVIVFVLTVDAVTDDKK